MSLTVPTEWEAKIKGIAFKLNLSAEEALEKILEAGYEELTSSNSNAPRQLFASLFGSVKGPGAYGSKEAVDKAIAEMRDEWD